MSSTRPTNNCEVATPEPEPGDENYHSARGVVGLSTVMFWSIVPILIVAFIIIIWLAL
jgi:hypothetical protein